MNFSEAIFKLDGIDFSRSFQSLKKKYGLEYDNCIDKILNACEINQGLCPKNVKGNDEQECIEKWVKKYKKGYDNRISVRTSNIPGTLPDKIIDTIINTKLNLTSKNLELIKYSHRLSMTAENILGSLLEEYLFNELKNHGWCCAWGSTIKSVDFCEKNGDLWQIKNRSNSENSSSSSVRDGTRIKKWYRVNAVTGEYKWDILNQEINVSHLSEGNFSDFVRQTLSKNKGALAIDDESPWNQY